MLRSAGDFARLDVLLRETFLQVRLDAVLLSEVGSTLTACGVPSLWQVLRDTTGPEFETAIKQVGLPTDQLARFAGSFPVRS